MFSFFLYFFLEKNPPKIREISCALADMTHYQLNCNEILTRHETSDLYLTQQCNCDFPQLDVEMFVQYKCPMNCPSVLLLCHSPAQTWHVLYQVKSTESKAIHKITKKNYHKKFVKLRVCDTSFPSLRSDPYSRKIWWRFKRE